ncbi:MAG: hypothetical protein ABSG03_09380 [Bryobacteraceae bacterium]
MVTAKACATPSEHPGCERSWQIGVSPTGTIAGIYAMGEPVSL